MSDSQVDVPASSQYASNMRKKISKAEKKVKKSMEKLNLTPLEGVSRISIRQGRLLFTIQTPEVFEIDKNSYLIFGEAKIDNMQKRPQMDELLKNVLGEVNNAKANETSAPVDDVEVDESELDSNDIQLVVDQAGVSRSVAVKALLDNEKDIVKAIISLTSK